MAGSIKSIMKIYFIGKSGSGKTSLINLINSKLNSKIISSSTWVRNSFRQKEKEESQDDFNLKLTDFALNKLKKDAKIATNYINNELINCDKDLILVDSIRNPYDFISTFDQNNDHVIFLECLENKNKETKFEKGISVIHNYMLWLRDNELCLHDVTKTFVLDYKCNDEHVSKFKGCDNNWYYCCLKSLASELITKYDSR